jgi:hypothetical protein
MSAIVDRIDNGDNYNEDDARRYFNELIDIVHSRPPKYHDDDDDDDDEDDHNQDANDQDANDRLLRTIERSRRKHRISSTTI